MYSAKRAVVNNLEKYMKLRGMNQAEISRKTGIKAPNVSEYCRGIVVPGLDVLEKFAEALGVSVASLVSETRLSDKANKVLSSPEFKEVTMTARHEHRAKSDFEWQGRPYKKGDIYDGSDIPVLLFMKLIEVSKSSYSVETNAPASSIPPRAWAAWNSRQTPKKAKQLAEMFLTRDKTILKEMDLSVGGLKAAEELLRQLLPPTPHPKDE